MIDEINSAIRCVQVEITNEENQGRKYKALERLDDLMLLIRLREAYKSAKERGLIY